MRIRYKGVEWTQAGFTGYRSETESDGIVGSKGGRTVDYRLPVPTLALGLVVVELGVVFVLEGEE
jgi:hypothetical protein